MLGVLQGVLAGAAQVAVLREMLPAVGCIARSGRIPLRWLLCKFWRYSHNIQCWDQLCNAEAWDGSVCWTRLSTGWLRGQHQRVQADKSTPVASLKVRLAVATSAAGCVCSATTTLYYDDSTARNTAARCVRRRDTAHMCRRLLPADVCCHLGVAAIARLPAAANGAQLALGAAAPPHQELHLPSRVLRSNAVAA